MPKFVFSVFFFLVSSTAPFAHEFYFAFAEMSYNEMSRRFEGTIIFTTHDLEKALDPKGSLIGKLEISDESSPIRTQLEQYINQHFNITYGCALDSNAVDAFCQSYFTLEGIATKLNGTIECYISSSKVAGFYAPVSIQFDALLEIYPAQQNKLTFLYRQDKFNLNFIPGKLIQTIPLQK
ncbi:MAG: DUF6702 family protein [Flavobacteriales bacterium]